LFQKERKKREAEEQRKPATELNIVGISTDANNKYPPAGIKVIMHSSHLDIKELVEHFQMTYAFCSSSPLS